MPELSHATLVTWIMSYEDGDLDDEQVVEFFQFLVNTGIVWQLQGSYGRTAANLISRELITAS
jgi:hypothetical protein